MAKDKNSEAAKKVAGAEKAANKKQKSDKPNIFARIGKAIARYFKDLRGETKKIIWPNLRTVVKSTGVVIVVVLIIGVGIWIVDAALSRGLSAVMDIGNTEEVTTLVQSTTAAATTQATTTAAQTATTAAPTTAETASD